MNLPKTKHKTPGSYGHGFAMDAAGIKGELMKPLLNEQRDYVLKAQRLLGQPGQPLTDQGLALLLGLKDGRRVRRWKSKSNPVVMGGIAYQEIERLMQNKGVK